MASASFWSLARLIHAPGGGRLPHRLVVGCGICGVIMVHSIRSEWLSSSSSACFGRSYTLNIFSLMPNPGIGGAQAATAFVQAMPGTRGAPRDCLHLRPNDKYTWQVAPGMARMSTSCDRMVTVGKRRFLPGARLNNVFVILGPLCINLLCIRPLLLLFRIIRPFGYFR
jgi:hypothetical protein